MAEPRRPKSNPTPPPIPEANPTPPPTPEVLPEPVSVPVESSSDQSKATVVLGMDQKEALEACRQVIKQNEFWVRCHDVLQASVLAENELPKKKALLDQADKELEEKKAVHDEALSQLHQAADLKKTDLVNEFNRQKSALMSEITQQEARKQKLYNDCAELATQIDNLRKERADFENSFTSAKTNAQNEMIALKTSNQEDKKKLEAELEGLRQAVRGLRSSLARLPAVG